MVADSAPGPVLPLVGQFDSYAPPTSPARRATLDGRSSAGAVQAVCNGPSMSAAQSTTVHDGLLHPHLRHCSSPASAGWQVTPYHSTRRTAASTPRTLLVASICRVAGNTRSAGCHQLFVPRHRRSMFGRRACSVAGPAACNSLSDLYLRDPSRSADSFRRHLKTFLFSFY